MVDPRKNQNPMNAKKFILYDWNMLVKSSFQVVSIKTKIKKNILDLVNSQVLKSFFVLLQFAYHGWYILSKGVSLIINKNGFSNSLHVFTTRRLGGKLLKPKSGSNTRMPARSLFLTEILNFEARTLKLKT